MKHLYNLSHKKASQPVLLSYSLNTDNERKIIFRIFIIIACLFINKAFSQNANPAPFNEAFWNAYADKLQLNPQAREEFMAAHLRDHLAAQAPDSAAAQPGLNKGGGNNSIFAGPCVNADFELGNLNGWIRSAGFHPGYNPLGCCPNPNGQQTIMSGAGNDPYGGFPVVYPGGNFSLRLGNNGTNGQADRIEQTFLVDNSNANFSYKYAVVFEDPNHPANEQPFFQVEMVDSTNTAVPCTFYHVAAGAGIPGFFNSPTAGVIYKPWSTVLVDLTPFIGQNITIRFSTYDCSLGGHFGYAYIDGVCQSFTGGGSGTVCAGGTTNFCAPEGIDTYTWTGPGVNNVTGQCIPVSAAGVYTVSTTLLTGCPGPQFTYTLSHQTPPVANAGADATVCANSPTVSVIGNISAYPSTPVWSANGGGAFTSTNSISTQYIPSAANISAGSATITLTTAGNGFCPAVSDQMVLFITPSPSVNAGTGGSSCNTNAISLNGSVTAGASTGSWSTSGNGSFAPSFSTLNASYTPGPAEIAGGTVTLTLRSTNNGNCLSVSDTVIIRIRQPATVLAGANQWYCSTTPTIPIAGIISGSGYGGVWASSGAGSFNPPNNLNTSYSIAPADITAGQVTFTISSTNNGPCPVVSDTVMMRVVALSAVNAGTNQFICSSSGSINLSGAVTGFSNTGTWSSSGAGVFSPGANVLTNSYALSPAELAGGLVTFTLSSTNNGPCAVVNDTVRMRVRIPATVNAGPNQALCSNTPSINLSGVIGGGSATGIWTSTGPGAFNPSNSANTTTYSLTAADLSAGSVIFTLSSTNNGPCPVVQDSVRMRITNLATINAGVNQFICSSAGVINLSGTINSPSNTVNWISNGGGSFLPSSATITPTYSLTVNDLIAGSVSFTVSSTNNGPCPVVIDSVMIAVKRLASMSAGSTQNICSNSPTIGLTGILGGGATTSSWSASGSGGFSPNNTNATTAYSITPVDINSGNVIFTITSTNNGPCAAVSSSMMATITKIATVTAGPNLYLCSNVGTINLAGTVNSPSNTVTWTSSGSGVFVPNANLVNATYSLSSSDINFGLITFTASSTNNGVCPVVRDTVRMRVMKLAFVNAGVNQALCSTQGSIALNGIVNAGGNAGLWTTTGTGSFNGSATALNTSYVMSQQDVSAGFVPFVLSSQNSTPCPEVTDTVQISILIQAQLIAGSSQTICSNEGSINLSGSISGGAGSLLWTASGNGVFNPASTSAVTAYSITPNDIAAGLVNFTIASTNNGPCLRGESSLSVVIHKLATVNAGADKKICSSQLSVPLQGVISGVTSTGVWSNNGAGTFTPNLPAGSYSVAAADVTQGTVLFILTSLNNGVCPVITDSMLLTIETRPEITVKADTSVCDKYRMISLGYTSTGGTALQWSTTGTGVFLPSNAPAATHYSLSPADRLGNLVTLQLGSSSTGPCGYTGAAMKVNILRGPHADFSASSYTIQIPGGPVQFTNLSSAAESYTWTFGDGKSSNLTDPSNTYQDAGFYNVTLYTRNSNNCVDQVEKRLAVVSDVQFATAFTPNTNGGNGGAYDPNDTSNDVFFPFAMGVVEYDMMIFNRWGELIFQSTDVKIGWDGYFNGKLCQQDTYVYKVNMAFFDGRKFNKTGSITLLR